jgi:hypothetical protein
MFAAAFFIIQVQVPLLLAAVMFRHMSSDNLALS